MSDARTPGLRLQIILALAGLMILAFVPLYVAVASLTRASIVDTDTRAAERLVRAIAAHADDARRAGGEDALRATVERHVARQEVDAARFEPRLAAASTTPTTPTTSVVRDHSRVLVEVTAPLETGGALVARVPVDRASARSAAGAQLVALYMGIFAIALMTFAYFALTRLIVRPVDALVRAADRVATGSRTLDIPRAGARELAELGASVRAMTDKILADEAALRAKLEELTEITARLRDARSQLERSERMASVGRLAAGVAHEVGNPLAAMMGMQELLLDGDLPASDQHDFLRRMKKETERIHVVIRDLLDFARPEKGSEANAPPADVPPADVRSVVDDVLALVAPQKGFKEIAVRAEIAEGDLRVTLPAPRLTQVLLNVVLNAGAAIGSQARAEAGTVVVRAEGRGARVRIAIEDDGPGVPAASVERIFEPFVTTKDVGEGTGLGLSVCRGLVEAADGAIFVDTTYTRGARFVIDLPRAR